jgi:hypothetical protein
VITSPHASAAFRHSVGSVADIQDFSGSYVLTGGKGDFDGKKAKGWTLHVVQTSNAVEVSKVTDGSENKNVFPLDGTAGPCVTSRGVAGTCKGQLKGKEGNLESLFTPLAGGNGPSVAILTKERWQLSSDLKTLTIRFDVDSPHSPVAGF